MPGRAVAPPEPRGQSREPDLAGAAEPPRRDAVPGRAAAPDEPGADAAAGSNPGTAAADRGVPDEAADAARAARRDAGKPIVPAEAAGRPSVLTGGRSYTQRDLDGIDILAPGNSPGWTRFAGDVALDGRILEIELGGTTFDFATSVFEYDRLIVEGGTALLDGPIDVQLYDSFEPLLGDVFDIVQATAVDLTGAEFYFPALSDGLVFAYQVLSALTGDQLLRLSVVDGTWILASEHNIAGRTGGTVLRVAEPGSLALMAIGLLGLGLCVRRRSREQTIRP